MRTYANEDFEHIAAAIGKDVADVTQHEKSFEVAALWYRQDCRAPKVPGRVAPSNLSKKMTQIANAARKLLRHLAVYDPRQQTVREQSHSWNFSHPRTMGLRMRSYGLQPGLGDWWRSLILSMRLENLSGLPARLPGTLFESANSPFRRAVTVILLRTTGSPP